MRGVEQFLNPSKEFVDILVLKILWGGRIFIAVTEGIGQSQIS